MNLPVLGVAIMAICIIMLISYGNLGNKTGIISAGEMEAEDDDF